MKTKSLAFILVVSFFSYYKINAQGVLRACDFCCPKHGTGKYWDSKKGCCNYPGCTYAACSNTSSVTTNNRTEYLGPATNTINSSGSSAVDNYNRMMQEVQQTNTDMLNKLKTSSGNQEMATSIYQLGSAISNLIAANRAEKERYAQYRRESEERDRVEKEVYKQLWEKTAPARKKNIDYLSKLIFNDYRTYYSLNDDDIDLKINISKSIFLKRVEKKKIESSKPQFTIYNDNVEVQSLGYLTPSLFSLSDYSQLKDSFSFNVMRHEFYSNTEHQYFNFGFDYPVKGGAYKEKKRSNFLYSNTKSIDLLYEHARVFSEEGSWANEYVAEKLSALDKMNYSPDSLKDFHTVISYYKGHNWKSLYHGGYLGLKKFYAMKLLADIILDSAVKASSAEGVGRALEQYSKAFNWYKDNLRFESSKNYENQYEILDLLFDHYSSAIMIYKMAALSDHGLKLQYSALSKKYISDFENYKDVSDDKESIATN